MTIHTVHFTLIYRNISLAFFTGSNAYDCTYQGAIGNCAWFQTASNADKTAFWTEMGEYAADVVQSAGRCFVMTIIADYKKIVLDKCTYETKLALFEIVKSAFHIHMCLGE